MRIYFSLKRSSGVAEQLPTTQPEQPASKSVKPKSKKALEKAARKLAAKTRAEAAQLSPGAASYALSQGRRDLSSKRDANHVNPQGYYHREHMFVIKGKGAQPSKGGRDNIDRFARTVKGWQKKERLEIARC